MSSFNFFDLLYSNLLIYFICLIFSLFIFFKIMKIKSSSWLNPLRFNIFTFAIGFSVILFLFVLGHIYFITLIYLIGSISIFWIVFIWIFKNKQRQVNTKFLNEPLLAQYLFVVSYLTYIFITLLSYKLLGIPIFKDGSRLSTYTGSGYGILTRFSPILYTYVIFYFIHLFHSTKDLRRIIIYIMLLLPLIIIGILSGSRSSFLSIIFIFWGYSTFYKHSEPKLRQYKWLIVSFVVVSIISFSIQFSGDFIYATKMFLQRIVSCGDLYWESLPNDTWKKVIINRPYEFTFMGLLGPLRILNPHLAEIPIGFQLTNIVYPEIAGTSTGPVALFPLFGLICFGYIGGLFFSFFQALLTSVLLNLVFVKSNSIIISSMFFFAFSSFLFLLGDISAGLGYCLDILISYGFVLFLLFILVILIRIGKTNK